MITVSSIVIAVWKDLYAPLRLSLHINLKAITDHSENVN